jgi:signal transduction histidine kinase
MRPPLRHRLTEAQRRRIDAAVALAAFAAAVFRVDLPRAAAAASAPPWVPVLVLIAFGTLPFAARRRLPLPVLAVLAVSAAALTGLGRSPLSLDVTVGIAAYTVAARAPRRVAVAALVAVEAALWAGVGVALARDVAGAYAAAAPLVAGALWFAGDSVSYRRQYDEAVAAERERRLLADRERARQAVREERVRIAREIHDVVAHSLTVMTVQAGVARRVVQRPDETSGMLESIETTGRVAQGELRLILGLLRDDEQEEPGLAPAPSLAALPALAEEVRAAGVPVELHVSGTKPALSPALELSLYRVIQEALTNTVKHAGRVPTTIRLSYGTRDIRVEVVNGRPAGAADGRPVAAWEAGTSGAGTRGMGGGHGLLGMRERVSAFGGTLVAGPVDGAGFRVAVRVPLREEA